MPLNFALFDVTVRTYTFWIAGGVLIAGGWAVFRFRGAPVSTIARVIDVGLSGVVLGLVCARLEYLLLHWSYFSTVTLPTAEWLFPTHEGGLMWHGAVIGGGLGIALAARLFRLDRRALWIAFMPALPLIALGGWLGCAAEGCAYGLEVDTLAHFSPLTVAETRDIYGIVAPRFATQGFGAALAIGVGALMIALRRRNQTPARTIGIGLAVLSAGMFVISGLRADDMPHWFGLRVDQVLDGVLIGWGAAVALRVRREEKQPAPLPIAIEGG